MKLNPLGAVLVGALLITAPGTMAPSQPAQADTSTESTSPTPTSMADHALPEGQQRYIVQYGDDANAEAESMALEHQGIEVKETFTHAVKASVVVATSGEIEALKDSGAVTSVEVDTPVSVTAATSLWGLDRIDQRTGRNGQFNLNEGAGVHIYVVDSGLNTSHTEFTGRVPASWSNVYDGRGVGDCAGHGTHVAGTAAGTTYGVAKKASVIPVRVLDCKGFGWSSTVMAGIDWVIAHHRAGQPAVMNLSVGGFTNAAFDQAVQNAVKDGITVVAAAGNNGVDACGASPARVAAAITVAATNIYDTQAPWSNYGKCVDLQAPGVAIRSAWSGAKTAYNTLDGTSMAAPHVAGAAAILLSRNRVLTPAQVHSAMISNANAGAVKAIKGVTPNRLLFIPAAAPAPVTGPPSCTDLRIGSAWAGVGTHCQLGKAAAAIKPEAAVTTQNKKPDSLVAAQASPVPAAADRTPKAPVRSIPPAPLPELVPAPPAPQVRNPAPEPVSIAPEARPYIERADRPARPHAVPPGSPDEPAVAGGREPERDLSWEIFLDPVPVLAAVAALLLILWAVTRRGGRTDLAR